MLYIPKIHDYLKTLTDGEIKDFVAIKFNEYFKNPREKLYCKLIAEQNPRKIAKSFYSFLATPDEVEKYIEIMQLYSSDKYVHRYNVEIFNMLDPELQLINTKPIMKNKLKELLNELEKFKVLTILV